MESNKNFSIQLIRVIAMLMIIVDHILVIISFPMQPIIVQVCNSGVFIFMLISGFLYGNKNIYNWHKWFAKRLTRICIPLWIFMVVDVILEAALWNVFDIKYVFIYGLNLQGILGVNAGGTNLWFLTLIMICYIITPLLQWIKQKNPSKNIGIFILVITIILQVVVAYTTDAGMVVGHTFSWCILAIGMYIIGYFVGNKIFSDNIGKCRIEMLTILTGISSAIVILMNVKFDGRIIYDRIVVFYGMIVLDVWICTVLYKLGQYIKSSRFVQIINHLDFISYEFYIVHGLIILAVTLNVLYKYGVLLYIISTMILAYLMAVLLHWICDKVYNIFT